MRMKTILKRNSKLLITIFMILQAITAFGQASVDFKLVQLLSWKYAGIQHEMLIFQDDLIASNATTYREPGLLMPVTVRMKSTDNKANVNIIEFDTNAMFKYTFNINRESTGFTIEIYPKNGTRVIKGKDILGLFTYKLTFDEKSNFTNGHVERTKLETSSVYAGADTENIATISTFPVNSEEEFNKSINEMYPNGKNHLANELLLRQKPIETYLEKKADDFLKHIKEIVAAKWSQIKGNLIDQQKDDENSIMSRYYSTQQSKNLGTTTIMLEYLFDKEISYPSHYVIIKEAATINERIIDLLAKKVKENFKEYSEITDSTENSDNIRDINFKTPNLFSKNINMYISKDGRFFIAISPEKFE